LLNVLAFVQFANKNGDKNLGKIKERNSKTQILFSEFIKGLFDR
jgi:hypothetical protein